MQGCTHMEYPSFDSRTYEGVAPARQLFLHPSDVHPNLTNKTSTHTHTDTKRYPFAFHSAISVPFVNKKCCGRPLTPWPARSRSQAWQHSQPSSCGDSRAAWQTPPFCPLCLQNLNGKMWQKVAKYEHGSVPAFMALIILLKRGSWH